jgi:hypothetical protein
MFKDLCLRFASKEQLLQMCPELADSDMEDFFVDIVDPCVLSYEPVEVVAEGYHVNVRTHEVLEHWEPFLVTPKNPRRKWMS